MPELWWMQSIPSLPGLQGVRWPEVVAPDRVVTMGQIELNCTHAELNFFLIGLFFYVPKLIVWNRIVYM